MVSGKQGHAPCKILLFQQILLLCQFDFFEIIRLSQHWGESGHPQLLGILPVLKQWCLVRLRWIQPTSVVGSTSKFRTLVSVCWVVDGTGSGEIFWVLKDASAWIMADGLAKGVLSCVLCCSVWVLSEFSPANVNVIVVDVVLILLMREWWLQGFWAVKRCGSLFEGHDDVATIDFG